MIKTGDLVMSIERKGGGDMSDENSLEKSKIIK
jgi:hypothetical protein